MSDSNRPSTGFRHFAVASLAGTVLFLTACATVPEAPHAALAEAQVAISTAEKDDAARYASPELREARQKLAQANTAVASEHMTDADRFAQQSRIAAELASARTETAKAMAVNDELSDATEALNEEIMRTGDRQ